MFGGGIESREPTFSMTGCLLRDNFATQDGGGVYWAEGLPSFKLDSCILFRNGADRGGALASDNCSYPDSVTFTDCILWGNSAQIGSQIALFECSSENAHDKLTLAECDLEGGIAAAYTSTTYQLFLANSIDADPKFVDPDGPDNISATDDDDLRVCPGSPAVSMVPSWLGIVECCHRADCDDLDPCNGREFCKLDRKCNRKLSDCNGNGTDDMCDVNSGASQDCDGNGVPDECQPDFDGDGLIDACDPDIDNDGVPNALDKCNDTPLRIQVNKNGRPLGDVNLDCTVDLRDFAILQRNLIGP
jgi:hypothetical protein